MASYDVETAFVGQFWRATDGDWKGDDGEAFAVIGRIRPDMLESPDMRRLYEALSVRWAEGEPNEPELIYEALRGESIPQDAIVDAGDRGFTAAQLPAYTARIYEDWQRRQSVTLYTKATAALGNGAGKDGGRALAERLQMRLLELYTANAGRGIQSKEQLIAEGKARAMAPEEAGISVPWPKLDKVCGPWIPGEVIAVSAYSGSGKSQFAANLFTGLVQRGVPAVVFPTEMGPQWLDRAVAAMTRTTQWRAEKRRWRGAEAEMGAYLQGWDSMQGWEWQAVTRPSMSVAEIAAATRVIRRRWEGPVVVMVDHMHRLDYGADDPNERVGHATQAMKNLAQTENLVCVLLYQPRKPAAGDIYRPIAGHELRGDSRNWNEVDVLLSPFRSWVKTESMAMTPWGTPVAHMVDDRPKMAKPEAEGAKLDDEHMYVKVAKRRVGGEGPTVILDFHDPSGCVYERAEADHEA